MATKFLTLIIFIMIISNQTMAQPDMPKKALLIIDIQDDFTGEKARMPVDKSQAGRMIDNLNRLIDRTDTSKVEVIYIGNEFSRSDFLNLFRNFAAVRGTPGIKIDERLRVATNIYFPKNKGNAFSNPELGKYLRSKNISDIYMTGLKAEACIYQTLKGALKEKYKVYMLTDCIATTSDARLRKYISKYETLGAINIDSSSF